MVRTKNTDNTAGEEKKSISRKRFPKKELNAWLATHNCWDHNEWTGLLNDLRTQGFEDWTDTPQGQNSIGLYLETTKKD